MISKQKISKALHELGMPANLNGYAYIISAIEMCSQDQKLVRAITKQLYPDIAKIHNVKPQNVERTIRHAIQVAFSRTDRGIMIDAVFGNSIRDNKGYPTNAQFIAMLTEYLLYN